MEENALWKDGRLRWGRLFHVVRFVPTALLLLPLVPFAKRSVPSFSGRLPEGSTRAVSLIGGVLIVANVLCGAAKINSYPFSVYPTFAVRADSTITTLQVKGIGESGRRIEVLGGAQDHEQAGFTSARFKGLFRSIRRIDEKEERAEKLHALWTVLQNRRSELKSITEVRFYQANYSTNPDRSSDRLLDRSLLTTIDVSSQSPATDSETD